MASLLAWNASQSFRRAAQASGWVSWATRSSSLKTYERNQWSQTIRVATSQDAGEHPRPQLPHLVLLLAQRGVRRVGDSRGADFLVAALQEVEDEQVEGGCQRRHLQELPRGVDLEVVVAEVGEIREPRRRVALEKQSRCGRVGNEGGGGCQPSAEPEATRNGALETRPKLSH